MKNLMEMLLCVVLCASPLLTAVTASASPIWRERIPFPSESEIEKYNEISSSRSPYIVGWMTTEHIGRYTEYSIDFKADMVPPFTYCSWANFHLDYSALKSRYASWSYEGIGGYAGLQQRTASQRANSILSFWDVYCRNEKGEIVNVIRAKLVYPEPGTDESFSGEGEGAHHLTDYPWKPGQWYRMLLQCSRSDSTGNTTIQQWICDLSSNSWTKLCEYDLGVPNVAFIRDNAVFLENFNPSTSGDVRTMEVRNARAKAENSTRWISIRSATFQQNYRLPGSYNFGIDGDTFWMITTGISGITGWKEPTSLTVSGGASETPY